MHNKSIKSLTKNYIFYKNSLSSKKWNTISKNNNNFYNNLDNFKQNIEDHETFKKLNTNEIKKLVEPRKEENNSDYCIENNKIKEAKKTLLIKDLNRYEGKKKLSKYDIKNIVGSKNEIKKLPSIKNIEIKNLKSFLEYNIKIKSKRNINLNNKKKNSIKLNFNTKFYSKKTSRPNSISDNLKINSEKIISKVNFENINNLKSTIKSNISKFKKSFNFIKSEKFINFINKKNEIKTKICSENKIDLINN